MHKKAIIFDFDGTLADTIPFIYKVANELAAQYEFKTVSIEEFNILRTKSPFEIIDQLKIPLLKIPFILTQGRKLLKKHMKEVVYIVGMKEVLETLKEKNYKIGLLTSNSRENIDIFIKQNSLNVFDFIYTENNIFGKQVSLSKILKKEKIYLGDVVYVGDEVRDIDACQALHLDIISVSWGFSSKDALLKYHPTALADKPADILNILGITD